jgi:hypothetical protein
VIPIEERVRVLNDLEGEGFYIPDVMGSASVRSGPNPATLERAWQHLSSAREALQEVDGAIAELGEIDPRVNLRMSIHGALELVELMRGAVEHAKRTSH